MNINTLEGVEKLNKDRSTGEQERIMEVCNAYRLALGEVRSLKGSLMDVTSETAARKYKRVFDESVRQHEAHMEAGTNERCAVCAAISAIKDA